MCNSRRTVAAATAAAADHLLFRPLLLLPLLLLLLLFQLLISLPVFVHCSHLAVLDKSGRTLALSPGMLDNTLLSEGSFSFGAKLVKFDKLNVLGNVYVRRINGKLLREAYLLKSSGIKEQREEKEEAAVDNNLLKAKRSGGRSKVKELRLKVLPNVVNNRPLS